MKERYVFRCAVLACLIIALCGIAYMAEDSVWPEATGLKIYYDGEFVVDHSNSSLGYIMIKGPKCSQRLKLRIKKDDTTFTYEINNEGEYEVFPLQLGSGTYAIQLYKNMKGNKYSEIGDCRVTAELAREDAAFLCPNQYVNYTAETEAVLKAAELCDGSNTDSARFEMIRDYIRKNFGYDFIRAVTVKSGMLPDIDLCYSTKLGICQDLAAMAVCMLRTQQIPAKLMVGYADKNYHAWVEVSLNGEAVLYDPTADLNAQYKNVVYTTERWY